ncbi:pirin [Pontibacillus chungwhensis BH030062]|uniref:Pirin n=1 Tax=Pontibacillus chungwhensis BH030062 TaxID=1385513 RepID=A0A0A2VDQ9_9BACI|nr:pirin-like C-terminal cupin domain-containing protein [Pontibacillus chungwhensis]KGP91800.1 pirin [Pontibacillus chungwhensis BH030062]
MQSENQLKRRVRDQWYVEYQEMNFPAIQKGWVLPADRWKDFDPFILMAEDWFKKGTFPDHPHRGFQTVTYVIDGRLEHIDNGGGRDILEPGDVQYMNAGWAARRAEDGVEDDVAHTLQLWLNLPQDRKQTETLYQNIYAEDAPIVNIDGGSIRVYSGGVAGVKGPMESIVPITLSEVNLTEDASYTLELPEDHNAFIYVLSGEVEVGEENTTLKKHGVATLSYQENGDSEKPSSLHLKGNRRRTRVLVYSGRPIKETIVPYGPFVMNSMEEIKQAFQDFRDGKFGPPAV